jgi:hypothetical protein
VRHDQVEAATADPTIDETASAAEAARLIHESVRVGSRLIQAIHPRTSFVTIPVFALANDGIELSGAALADAVTSRVTLDIAGGLIIGKVVENRGCRRHRPGDVEYLHECAVATARAGVAPRR